jgi:hypothetical protein
VGQGDIQARRGTSQPQATHVACNIGLCWWPCPSFCPHIQDANLSHTKHASGTIHGQQTEVILKKIENVFYELEILFWGLHKNTPFAHVSDRVKCKVLLHDIRIYFETKNFKEDRTDLCAHIQRQPFS